MLLETPAEQVQSFKYLGCVVNKNGTNGADIESKVMQGRKVVGVIRKTKVFSLECARLLYESMLFSTSVYGRKRLV